MKYVVLFLPVVFSVSAQLLIKTASLYPMRSKIWFLIMLLSIASYIFAFILYSNTVRYYAISVASPVNTLAVMIIVIIAGVVIWNEVVGLRQIAGLFLGIISLYLLSSS